MDKIAVLDFGGQYAHLIANRVRRIGVYTEIFDGEVAADKLRDFKGVILSGGPATVRNTDSLLADPGIFALGVPILGICYGHQVMGHMLGGQVEQGKVREYGSATVRFAKKDGIFDGVGDNEKVWMSHFDQVVSAPKGFEVIASTDDCEIAAMADTDRGFYGVQFHPEVTHTPCGHIILENFVNITGAKREWNIDTYIDDIVEDIKKQAGDRKVFLMISGGVDSTVAFLLLDKALGQERVYGLFVDTGFMRKNEREEVESSLKEMGVENLHVYDASKEYFDALESVCEPEKKRQIIGDLFLDIKQKVSDDLGLNPDEWMLGQGTIYPDTIETAGTKHADKIKTHHNQVDRIKELTEQGKVIEPLKMLYKDEVRMVGERLGLAEEMVWRHPFPGPGLAVRCLCAEKKEEVAELDKLASEIDDIAGKNDMKAMVLPIKSVGVQGDERTYAHPVLVYGDDPSWDELNRLSTRLTNQFKEVNRVLYGLYPADFSEIDMKPGELNRERITLLQEADKVVMDFISEVGINREIWQFPTVLLPLELGGGECIVLRPINSEEAMTANFYHMEWGNLQKLLDRLKKIDGVGGVFYDITNKPPGTIEWE